MKHTHLLLGALFLFNSASLYADNKRVFDKITHQLSEVCATNPDGTLLVAIHCNASHFDPASTKNRRQLNETIEVITPPIEHSYPVAVTDHAVVHVRFGLANGESMVQFIDPTEKTDKKFTKGSFWLVPTKSLDAMVDKTSSFKKGDMFCLKSAHGKYSAGQVVSINGLFEKDQSASVHFEKSFLARFFDFYINEPSNLVELNNLVPCLDPKKIINTSAPTQVSDSSINEQKLIKENTEELPNQKAGAIDK